MNLKNFIGTYKKCTLILNALLNPDAKNPPNGPMTELNNPILREWKTNGYMLRYFPIPNCRKIRENICIIDFYMQSKKKNEIKHTTWLL